MSKKKICHVLVDRSTAGVGRWLLNYFKYYNKELFNVVVVLPKGSPMKELLEEYGCEITYIHSVRPDSTQICDIKMFSKIFKIMKPDLVQVHGCFTAIIGAKLAGVKYVINTKHIIEDRFNKKSDRFLKKYLNMIFTVKIIAISEAVKESLINIGINKGHIEKIYNGIEMIEKMSDKQIMGIKKGYNIDENCHLVGIIAKLEPIKDLSTFLLAAEKVSHIRNDIKFIVTGTGSLEEDLKDEAEILKIKDTVIFTGHVQDVEKIINILDIMVMTSKSEALSLSVIEAMSLGIPSIGTNSGGMKEVINDKVTGELIDVGNFNLLADRIIELIDNKELYAEYSKNCIKIVEQKFSAKAMAEKLEKVYINYLKI